MTEQVSTGAAASNRRFARHPLLGGFPMAVMTLAVFLVIFTLMMARLGVGGGPALHLGASPVALTAGSTGPATVTTRASGAAGASPVVRSAAGQGVATVKPAIVTRTSGARIGDD